MTALSLAAQHPAHAHISETAVQGQHADSSRHSSTLDCHLEQERDIQTDGSSGPDQDSAHFTITTVAADQADREEEVSDVEEEEYEEQDSAHMTITHAAADQAEEEQHDGPAEEEEHGQQSEPAQHSLSSDADEDERGGSSSEDDSGGSGSEYEEDDQEGKAVTLSSSAGSSGTSTVPSSSPTASSDDSSVPTPAGDHITVGVSAAIQTSPEDAGSPNVSTDGPPAVPSFEAEGVGDVVVSLAAAAQQQ